MGLLVGLLVQQQFDRAQNVHHDFLAVYVAGRALERKQIDVVVERQRQRGKGQCVVVVVVVVVMVVVVVVVVGIDFKSIQGAGQ